MAGNILKNKKKIAYLLFLLVPLTGYAQQVNLENMTSLFKAKPLTISGGIAANGMYSDGSNTYGRDPFNYYLQGSLNMRIYEQINLPFSFSLTNQGKEYSYPTAPNRLSLHPSYKWVHAHIGDVAMSFSPYTLAGHQFTGAGVDLDMPGQLDGLKISAMYGRLQKATENNLAPGALPSYRRHGFGTKASYEHSFYKIGMIVFTAQDKDGSFAAPPDSLFIYPQKNTVLSWDVAVKPAKNLRLAAEYAVSALVGNTKDSIPIEKTGLFQSLGGDEAKIYHAWRVQTDYLAGKGSIGLAYERVDPGYATLGGYYFNNDLQSIAITFAQAIFKEKVTISGNLGLQNDNLNNAKSGTTKRTVWALNVGINPAPKWQLAISYSSFQTHMHIRDQFEYINQQSDIQYIDTLNYVQISQNAHFTVGWTIQQSEQQNQTWNLTCSFQDASDEQGGVVTNGNSSQFYNMATSYNLSFPKKGLAINANYNLSYNTIGRNNILTHGPSLSAGVAFLKQRLTTGMAGAYNQSLTGGEQQSSVLNIRLNAAYTLFKKHRINFSLTNQYRHMKTQKARDLIILLGYNYSF